MVGARVEAVMAVDWAVEMVVSRAQAMVGQMVDSSVVVTVDETEEAVAQATTVVDPRVVVAAHAAVGMQVEVVQEAEVQAAEG